MNKNINANLQHPKIKVLQMKLLGVTLIELLISVAIMGVLASVAYPSYVDYAVRANRSEAVRELLRIANLQEQYFVDNRTYTTDLTDLGLATSTFISESGNYSLTATIANSGSTFILTATTRGSQATLDTECTTLAITEASVKTAESGHCWTS